MASGKLRESGCLGVLILIAVWVVLFFYSLFTETDWLILATSLCILFIPLGYFIGEFLGGKL